MRLDEVSLAEVHGPLSRIRWQEERPDMVLVGSIAKNGLVRPLLLSEADKGYEVVLGWRRLQALKALVEMKITSLPPGLAWLTQDGRLHMLALIAEEMTVAQAMILSFIDNELGRDLSPFEQCKCIQVMVEDLGQTVEQVADKLDKSTAEVTWNLRALQDLSEDGVAAWQNGRLATAHVKELLRVRDGDLRAKLLWRTLKEGLSAARLAFLVDQSRGTDQVPAVERPLFDLRNRIQSDEWFAVRMQAGAIALEDSRKGDRLIVDYDSPQGLREIVKRLSDLLAGGSDQP